jgi:NAD(P)-dependent dehydrogenase (short-subunit alcohol dehydrogenase family)
MSRVLVTGSADGLGRAAAETLLQEGHRVIVHARSSDRLSSVQDLLDRGAQGVVGDLGDLAQTRSIAEEVSGLGRVDAVIHNAGVYDGPAVLPVNVVAPYLLTALMDPPPRLVFLSSGMHRGGRADLSRIDWTGRGRTGSYSDSKLFVTTLAFAIANRWPAVASNAVNPGWVPTRMGGPGAPDDLRLGHRTQEWLATSDDPEARSTGGYWFHQQRHAAHPAAQDPRFQGELLRALEAFTGVALGGTDS